MYTVILCGGFGTRLREETEFKPKPMINIGTKPILWHIMKSYSHFGFYNFILTLGYKSEIIKNFFLNYHNLNNDIEVKLSKNNKQIKFLNNNTSEVSKWKLILSETGLESSTGFRLWLIKDYLIKNENSDFMVTYGDGVADININQLIKFHKKSGKLGTITAVNNQSRFGNLVIENGICKDFKEKLTSKNSWINGGFCIFNKKVLEFLTDKKEESFEEGLLTRLTQKNELAVYKHNGFWQCMDTNREVLMLNEIWKKGKAPWKTWK